MRQLDPQLVERVFARLGMDEAPPVDPAGLRTVYRQWCRSVPFDNTLKLIALHDGSGGPLPSFPEFTESAASAGRGALERLGCQASLLTLSSSLLPSARG